jgi:phosphatidylserine decarboxylase
MSFKRALSRVVGWAADRHLPRPLRAPLYRAYARLYRVDLSEAQLPPAEYPSLGAFFVRRLAPGKRPVDANPEVLVSPVDGRISSIGAVERGTLLQAKGRYYGVRELLGGVGAELDLEGAQQWTLYLSPRDYHRIHAPEAGALVEVRPIRGELHSVNAMSLGRRDVLAVNERVALRYETARGTLLLVLVGALNVGRIRVVGVEPTHSGRLAAPRLVARGEELARFELGSTIVLIAPRGMVAPLEALREDAVVRLGAPLGQYLAQRAPAPRP